jgi:hypothetical protein
MVGPFTRMPLEGFCLTGARVPSSGIQAENRANPYPRVARCEGQAAARHPHPPARGATFLRWTPIGSA